jgi:hypothetical protein
VSQDVASASATAWFGTSREKVSVAIFESLRNQNVLTEFARSANFFSSLKKEARKNFQVDHAATIQEATGEFWQLFVSLAMQIIIILIYVCCLFC